MAGTASNLPNYDTSQVGTPYQEFIKSLPILAGGFDTVYGALNPSPIDNAVQQPAQPTQPAPKTAGINGTTLAYAGLGLGALIGVVLLVKAVT